MTDIPAKKRRHAPYKRPAHRVLATALDTNEKVRAELVTRIAREINRADIPVAVLHQVAQCLEMWRA